MFMELASGVIKHGVLENGPSIEISEFPSKKSPFTSGIFQAAMFDDTRGYCTIGNRVLDVPEI